MSLSYQDIHLRNVGGRAGEADLMWGTLTISFKDTSNDHSPLIDLLLLLKNTPQTTLGELKIEARENAISILKAALHTLEQDDIETLERQASD